MSMKTKTVFFGSSIFSLWVLMKLVESKKVEIIGVITNPDAAVGRKREVVENVVKAYAKQQGITVYEKPSHLKQMMGVDVAITASYGHIIKQELLDIPLHGFINVHGSYLPALRGAIPIQKAIYDGQTHTGVTIMKMDAGMDTGDIIAQKEITIEKEDTFKTLGQKMANIGSDLLLASLDSYLADKSILVAQDAGQATYCYLSDIARMKNISVEMSAEAIERAVRAFGPYELLTLQVKGIDLLLISVKVGNGNEQQGVGDVFSYKDEVGRHVFVQCREGALELIIVKPKGKNEMHADAFWNGYGNRLIKSI